MASDAFTPFLSVYTDTAAAPLVEAAVEDGAAAQAIVEAEAGGRYIVEAAGERRSDRGAYTIGADFGGADFGDGALAGLAFDGALTAGATATGSVRSSAGEVWLFLWLCGRVRDGDGEQRRVHALSRTLRPGGRGDPGQSEAVDEHAGADRRRRVARARWRLMR